MSLLEAVLKSAPLVLSMLSAGKAVRLAASSRPTSVSVLLCSLSVPESYSTARFRLAECTAKRSAMQCQRLCRDDVR